MTVEDGGGEGFLACMQRETGGKYEIFLEPSQAAFHSWTLMKETDIAVK